MNIFTKKLSFEKSRTIIKTDSQTGTYFHQFICFSLPTSDMNSAIELVTLCKPNLQQQQRMHAFPS